jgi:AcrR family transcriptional regulator
MPGGTTRSSSPPAARPSPRTAPRASLEEIARRAGVGIGTLYRHFPTRQALLEAVYVEEVDALCRSADDLADRQPWDALMAWLHRFVEYMATKQALSEELFAYIGRDSDVFLRCHTAFYAAGEPLLARAQDAHVVRADTDITEVVRMVAGIAKMPSSHARADRTRSSTSPSTASGTARRREDPGPLHRRPRSGPPGALLAGRSGLENHDRRG